MLKFYLLMTSLVLVITLTACNLPGSLNATQQFATQAAKSPPVKSATMPPSNTPDSDLEDTPTPLTTVTLTPSQTANPLWTLTPRASPTLTPPCDRASPGNPLDITIPDDSYILPGQAFSKTWRLVNVGSCNWTQGYAVVYFSGSQMSAVPRNSLPEIVAPGGTVDVSVDMIAPDNPGVYQGNWKISNSEGHLFGIGPNGDSPFWVRIIVIELATSTLTLTPAPTLTPTPVVYASGQAALKPEDGLDLDTNTTANPPTNAGDVIYTIDANHIHRLEATNGVQLGAPGSIPPPSYLECIAAPLKIDPLVLDGLAINSTLCYRTNQGLPGWARLVSLDPKSDILTLEILTWAIP